MKLRLVVVAVLLGTTALSGCSTSGTSCEDADGLAAQLARTDRFDATYDEIQDKLRLAESDCNA